MCEDYRALRRRRSRDGHGGFRGGQEDHLPGADPVGRDRRGRAQQQAAPEIWKNYATDIRGAKALPCGHYLSEEAPEETYAELRAFFKTAADVQRHARRALSTARRAARPRKFFTAYHSRCRFLL